MKRSKRAWWNSVLVAVGPWLVTTGIAGGLAAGDRHRPESRRVPMRLAVQEEEAEETPEAMPDEAAPPKRSAAPVQEEPWFDEWSDPRVGHRNIWGPVWRDDSCAPSWTRPGLARCSPRLWAQAEYLIWFQNGTTLPPLVTTSFQGTDLEDAGVLGEATTTLLYGNQTVGDSSQSGGRLTIGWWLDDCEYASIGGRGFILDTQQDSFSASDDTASILARPYFDVSDNQPEEQNALVIAFPGVQTGQINVTTTSDVSGGDFFLRRQVYKSCLSRVDFWLGYQYARIAGDLSISSSTTEVSGSQLDVFDQFATRNEYHAATLGFLASYDRPTWHCELLAKVGLGRMHQSATLTGSNTLTDGTDETTSPVGLLVRSTNSGATGQDKFSVSPELGVNLSWRVTQRLDLSVAYSFIYWTNVLTPAGTIDPNLAVNLSEPPTDVLRPGVSMRDGDYWVHGVSFGLTGRF